jgi:hypothetical protein
VSENDTHAEELEKFKTFIHLSHIILASFTHACYILCSSNFCFMRQCAVDPHSAPREVRLHFLDKCIWSDKVLPELGTDGGEACPELTPKS